MKLLMIDNYDSFTFNLVQYLGELGAAVEVVRNDALTVEAAIAKAPDAFVISPGPCTPNEAGISVELIRKASGAIPILGVCLGHQSMAAAWGGSIIRTGAIMHGKTSPISHRNTDVFAGLPNPFQATRYHSLMADPADLPECLEVTAWTDDIVSPAAAVAGDIVSPAAAVAGDPVAPSAATRRIIMGLAHREHATWGVQFHPESILTIAGKQLLANFLDLVRARTRAAA